MSFAAAKWTTKYMNDLTDSAFALIVKGEKDEECKIFKKLKTDEYVDYSSPPRSSDYSTEKYSSPPENHVSRAGSSAELQRHGDISRNSPFLVYYVLSESYFK